MRVFAFLSLVALAGCSDKDASSVDINAAASRAEGDIASYQAERRRPGTGTVTEPHTGVAAGRKVDASPLPADAGVGGTPAIEMEQVAVLAKDGYNMHKLTYVEHVGTHFDAPLHFSTGGA